MEIIVQFLQPGMAFLARGNPHVIHHVFRQGAHPASEGTVLVIGHVEPDRTYFDATFDWGDSIDIVNLGETVVAEATM